MFYVRWTSFLNKSNPKWCNIGNIEINFGSFPSCHLPKTIKIHARKKPSLYNQQIEDGIYNIKAFGAFACMESEKNLIVVWWQNTQEI